jgi:uncharacterized membrane protein YtjA (UPF0391 family)
VPGRGLVRPADGRAVGPEVALLAGMLKLALFFFVVSLIAGVLGFTGVASTTRSIAKVLFFIALAIFLIVLVFGVFLGVLVF